MHLKARLFLVTILAFALATPLAMPGKVFCQTADGHARVERAHDEGACAEADGEAHDAGREPVPCNDTKLGDDLAAGSATTLSLKHSPAPHFDSAIAMACGFDWGSRPSLYRLYLESHPPNLPGIPWLQSTILLI